MSRKLITGVERPVHDGVDRLLVESADRVPHRAAPPAERHRAQAQLGDEHAGIGQLSIFHTADYVEARHGEQRQLPRGKVVHRFLGVVAACAAGLYLVLFVAAIGPPSASRRRRGSTSPGTRRRSGGNRSSLLRYYGSVQGDAYLYFELGMRMAGRPLPYDSVAARRMSRTDAGAIAITAPQLPYRDFSSVYPPLAVIYFGVLARMCDSFDSFFLMLRCLNLLAVIAIVALSYEHVRRRDELTRADYVAISLTLVAAVGPRWLCMYDALPALCVSIALHACCRRRPAMAGAALAAGTSLKIIPCSSVLWRSHLWHVRGWKGVGQCLAAGLLATTLMLSPWLITSPGSIVTGVLTQASRQYLTYDSALGSLFVIGRQVGLAQFQYGDELESRVVNAPASRTLAAATMALMLMAVAGLTAAYGIGLRRTGRVRRG